jgi:hypothetical protein
MFDRLDRFHQSKVGYAVFALVELALAYLFVSWALDSGSWWDYLLVLIFTVGFLQNAAKLVGKIIADRKRHNRLHR